MCIPIFDKHPGYIINVEIPSNKCPREALIKTLDEMVYSREIVEYKIHD